MQCTAKVYKTGQQCRRRAVAGMRVCQVHGGATPRGFASPHFKDGRYSKSLPARLAARYAEAEADPRLLELNQDIALVDTRLGELLEKIDTGETAATWLGLSGAYASLRAAMQRKDTGGMTAALNTIDRLITQGSNDYAVWEDIGRALEQRRKLVESENKRRKDMQEFISTQQALALMGAIVKIVKDHVTDTAQLRAISHAIDALALTESGG